MIDSLQPSLVIGTAGHIDHGKSSLIKALTGTDPDRLAEEKRRGITIELGFARLTLPSGRTLGVVDVPGHERFVRHMVAGATGIDVALIAIAADDGIMPQTIEHLAVLELLGVQDAVIALTKIDLVDSEWQAFMTDEIAHHLTTSPFAKAPIISVSSRTNVGLDKLAAALDTVAASATRTKDESSARMPVDRVFSIKGFGTVVTGSLWSGTIAEGDELIVLPTGRKTRVRSIQMHGEAVIKAPAGNRVAASLVGLSTDDIRPGDFICAPDVVATSERFDADLAYLDPFSYGKPLTSGTRVHIAHGTREVIGRILLMDNQEELASGSHALAQIRLDEPLPLAYRDRFIVRSYSPTHVIGGGVVLSAHPRRRTILKPSERNLLSALAVGDIDRAIGAYLELVNLPETAKEIAQACGLPLTTVEACLNHMEAKTRLTTLGDKPCFYARGALLQKYQAALEKALLAFHSTHPSATGISKEELRHTLVPHATRSCFDALLSEAQRRGTVICTGGEISHPKAAVRARTTEDKTVNLVACRLNAAGIMPPEFEELVTHEDIDPVVARKALARLVEQGRVVRVEKERWYDAAAVEQCVTAVQTYLAIHNNATAAELKEAMGTTRKFAMPMLEYFDSIGLTHREGDTRTLAHPSSDINGFVEQ